MTLLATALPWAVRPSHDGLVPSSSTDRARCHMRSFVQHLAAAGARRSTLSHLPELTRLVTEVTQFIRRLERFAIACVPCVGAILVIALGGRGGANTRFAPTRKLRIHPSENRYKQA